VSESRRKKKKEPEEKWWRLGDERKDFLQTKAEGRHLGQGTSKDQIGKLSTTKKIGATEKEGGRGRCGRPKEPEEGSFLLVFLKEA